MSKFADKVAAVATGLHATIYRASDGKLAGQLGGVPMLVLETTGRKSGKVRARPLMKIEHEGHPHVIASANGSDEHPAWFLNLQANTNVRVQDGDESYAATAVILEGAERDTVYELAKQRMDNFVGYERKASRTIPVIRLDRA